VRCERIQVFDRHKRLVVIPGQPAGLNPESGSSICESMDSGSPLRGVRNDEKKMTSKKNPARQSHWLQVPA
jgi:hypothetical protein